MASTAEAPIETGTSLSRSPSRQSRKYSASAVASAASGHQSVLGSTSEVDERDEED